MPRYKVIETGFFNGKMYSPNGKRKELHTAEPFPKSTKGLKKGQKGVEQVPSWLKRLPDQSPAEEQARIAVEEAEALAAAEALANDQKEIENASFMGEGEKADSGVETL